MTFFQELRRWREDRRNIRLLQSMSDRQLHDMGVSRSDIPRRVRSRG